VILDENCEAAVYTYADFWYRFVDVSFSYSEV